MPNSPEFSFANIAEGGSGGKEPVQLQEDPKTELPKAPILEDEDSISYLGVKLEKSHVSSAFVPEREKYTDYINDKFSLELQQKIAVSMLQGDPILIEGGTSIGKTTTVRKMCAELGYEVHYANLNGATDVEDLMGRYIPNPHKTNPEDPEYVFADGKVTSGLRKEEGKKKIIILDEFNASAPNILIRLHEVIDALERGGEVVLSEDASEVVHVSHEDTKIIALTNPPGKGYFGREPLDPAQLRRWVYQKEVTELPDSTFAFSTEALFGIGSRTEEIPDSLYLDSPDQAISREQLAEISGMKEILDKYQEFHKAAKELIKQRMVAADQPQPFTFDDRMEPHRISRFVARFYNGDINETFQRGLRYYYVNKLENSEDRQKLEELISHVSCTPAVDSRRRAIGEPETKTPESALKTRAEKEIEDIMSSSEIPDSVKAALAGKETPLSSEILEQMKEAKEIFGNDFLGPEEVKAAFLDQVEISEVPSIPFSKEELEKARELEQMLILRVDKAKDGSDLTMEKIHGLLNGKIKDEAKVLYSVDWYKDEEFYKKDKPEVTWALVSKEAVPDSSDKNYLEQTETLANYLRNEVFKTLIMPAKYGEALREFEKEKASIARIVESDKESEWKEAARKLEALKLNQLTRQSPTEALYDLIVRYQQTGERLMENMYTWTKRRDSGGGLVCVGRFESVGVRVGGGRPGDWSGILGVSFSRSL
ncbi:MAG: AAA family ATPase [Patescibacteria group bacterium]